MKINFLKKTGIIAVSILGTIYLLFLVLPFIITPIANQYLPTVNEEITKAIGLNSKIEGFKIVTTPKLTIGAGIKEFELLTPDNKKILKVEKAQVKMSLLPLLAKKIELDLITAEDIEIALNLNKDGSFEIEKYFPQTEKATQAESSQTETVVLPFGLRLSNHLPDIKIREYDIEFIDSATGKKYEIEGDKTELTDFILNKEVKIVLTGKAKFDEREQFVYKVKVLNRIMPDIDLHELVFNPPSEEEKKEQTKDIKINILDIFKGIYNNKITANIDTDLILSKDSHKGYVKVNNLSIVNLPSSIVNMKFRGQKIDIDSSIYTAKNEVSTVKGFIETGKKANVDLNFKSHLELNNIIKILNAVALTFNIKDLQTLTANGKLDADFNIKSNLKTVTSNGYLKIPSAKIYYGLYNTGIDNINADIALDNNRVNIKNIGFSILNQPLKLYGTITQDAVADVHLLAENLGLKGLIVACGQAALLKDNNVNSGMVTLKADIVGKLDKIQPTAKVILSNINIKNIPANTIIKLAQTNIDVIANAQTFSGRAFANNINIVNPAAVVSIPKISANIKEDIIEITQTPVKVENINFNVSGKIKNYLTEKITLDFMTVGDIKSTLKGEMNIVKQILNLVFATTDNSTIVIPMFDKSKMTFNTNLSITGNMLNPQVSGTANVLTLSIPEIPVSIDNLTAKLHGVILNGTASVAKFASGGIAAQDCTATFSMKGENFYLTNLKGTAFDGKINGNIIYNMSDFKTTVDFHGQGLDAQKAVAGAVGISNALTGTLGFDTNLTLKVVDYEEMIRSMKGNLSFKVSNGAFGKIGRFDNFFSADNIVNNYLLKTTVAALSNLGAIKNTAKFEYITGNMSFSNGWANLASIKSSGQTLSYYVTGKFNLINMTTNVVVLGRLDQSVVALLGPLGELSADKLLSAIPKFGNLTASIVNILTTNPRGEKISEIPALANGSNSYKDFKVVFNGGLDSSNSIKSFKWLTKVDTTALNPQQNAVETIKSLKTTVGSDVQNVIDTVKSQKDALKTTADELKSLFKF